MKWYPAMFANSKDQIDSLDNVGVKHRLVSFYFIHKQIQDSRRKIVGKKVRELWKRSKRRREQAEEGEG